KVDLKSQRELKVIRIQLDPECRKHWVHYRDLIQAFLTPSVSSTSSSQTPQQNYEAYQSLLRKIIRDSEEELGHAPCEYVMLGLEGHISMLPYFPLKVLVLVKEESAQHHHYFSFLWQLVELKLASLGVTSPLVFTIHPDFRPDR